MQTLDSRTKNEGVAAAEAVGTQYFSDTIGKVQLHRLTADYGIDRIELREMDKDSDAMTVRRPDGGYTLFLNSAQPRIRHRFSVAHELAHLMLTPILGERIVHRRRFSKKQDPFGDQIEYLCNDMASAILMPSSHVQEMLDRNKQSARCVPGIAKTFDTSFEAASRRFLTLSKERCGLVVWNTTPEAVIRYSRRTIWNNRLGHCVIELAEQELSPALRSFHRRPAKFVSSEETILFTSRRRIGSNRQKLHNVTVESFPRINRGKSECWSFIRFDHSAS